MANVLYLAYCAVLYLAFYVVPLLAYYVERLLAFPAFIGACRAAFLLLPWAPESPTYLQTKEQFIGTSLVSNVLVDSFSSWPWVRRPLENGEICERMRVTLPSYFALMLIFLTTVLATLRSIFL
jgi:hypothetical protein